MLHVLPHYYHIGFEGTGPKGHMSSYRVADNDIRSAEQEQVSDAKLYQGEFLFACFLLVFLSRQKP